MDEGAGICLLKNLPRAYFALEMLFQLFDITWVWLACFGYDVNRYSSIIRLEASPVRSN